MSTQNWRRIDEQSGDKFGGRRKPFFPASQFINPADGTSTAKAACPPVFVACCRQSEQPIAPRVQNKGAITDEYFESSSNKCFIPISRVTRLTAATLAVVFRYADESPWFKSFGCLPPMDVDGQRRHPIPGDRVLKRAGCQNYCACRAGTDRIRPCLPSRSIITQRCGRCWI